MKKLFVLAAAVALVMAAAFSADAATIVGSKHDLKAALPTSQQTCVFCHTAHQPNGQTTDPLWNHTLSSTASYGVYDSPTLDATPTDIGGGTAVSNLCMSCHDGTVGPGSLYNKPNIATGEETPVAPWAPTTMISGNANMGTSLSNDHPVNFTYDAALVTADGGLKDPTAAPISDWLIGGTVQCSSCHDVHDPTYLPFLRTTNVASALCTSCHIK